MVIRVQERAPTETGFGVQLTIGEHTVYVSLDNPHSQRTEERFEWYFEQYISEPYIAETRVTRAREELRNYGLSLFAQLFQHPETKNHYRSVLDRYGFDRLIFEVEAAETSVDFHHILWESLRDPQFPESPLAAKGVAFYRSSRKPVRLPSRVEEKGFLNLLIVTARPSEENDVGYRTIQRPLVELIRQKSHLRIRVHILRPGTFKALKQHLNRVGSGHYHMIHFDLHGEVTTHKKLVRGRRKGTLLFSPASSGKPQLFNVRFGVDDLEPFEGRRAFLFFETEEKGRAAVYSATEVASLVRDHRIPVCILNACQSAKQPGTSQESSLAEFLYEQGLDFVLAMRYSVSVTASTLLMQRFYAEIFDGQSTGAALVRARTGLYDERMRPAELGYQIDLDDWVLPVVFQNQPVEFSVRPLEDSERTELYRQRRREPVFPRLQYGFLGRDLDILKIEKLLLPPRNHLLLRGMVGVGKSTLLRYLAQWWISTRFRDIRQAVYLDASENTPTLPELVLEIARQIGLQSEGTAFREYDTMTREELLLDELNRHPYALLFDGIFRLSDSGTVRFLSRIRDASVVVYGSVNEEATLGTYTFGENSYQLEGFDPSTARNFAGKIVKLQTGRSLADFVREDRKSTEDLLEVLAGFPRMLEWMLPMLETHSPAELLTLYRRGELPAAPPFNAKT